MKMSFIYHPVGVIRTPYKEPEGTPIQASAAKDTAGIIEIFSEYTEGLQDLDGFSHIILLYHFHLSGKVILKVKPFLDIEVHGVFATRAPARPNPIGLSVVRLKKIEKNRIHIQDVDILDGTPLLDIKPYVPDFDHRETNTTGWLTTGLHKLKEAKDDGRFSL